MHQSMASCARQFQSCSGLVSGNRPVQLVAYDAHNHPNKYGIAFKTDLVEAACHELVPPTAREIVL